MFCGLLAVASHAHSLAGEVNLAWDASVGASGYKIYSGSSSGNYAAPVDVGASTQSMVNSMPDCSTTYFVVTAYNSAGESGFSSEIASWPRPILGGTNVPQGTRGSQVNLVLSGTNFQSGASIGFSEPAITLNSASVDACGQITANITIGSGAPFGPVDISVTNPNGVSAVASGLFEVIGDPLPNVDNLIRTDKK